MGEFSIARPGSGGGKLILAHGQYSQESGASTGTISLAKYGFSKQPAVMLSNRDGTVLQLTAVSKTSFSWSCGRNYANFYWMAIGE